MRFVGLVIALSGAAVAYFLGYKGMSVADARNRLAQLLNLPGLAAPPASAGDGAVPPPAPPTPGGRVTVGSPTSAPGRPFNPKGNLGTL